MSEIYLVIRSGITNKHKYTKKDGLRNFPKLRGGLGRRSALVGKYLHLYMST